MINKDLDKVCTYMDKQTYNYGICEAKAYRSHVEPKYIDDDYRKPVANVLVPPIFTYLETLDAYNMYRYYNVYEKYLVAKKQGDTLYGVIRFYVEYKNDANGNPIDQQNYWEWAVEPMFTNISLIGSVASIIDKNTGKELWGVYPFHYQPENGWCLPPQYDDIIYKKEPGTYSQFGITIKNGLKGLIEGHYSVKVICQPQFKEIKGSLKKLPMQAEMPNGDLCTIAQDGSVVLNNNTTNNANVYTIVAMNDVVTGNYQGYVLAQVHKNGETKNYYTLLSPLLDKDAQREEERGLHYCIPPIYEQIKQNALYDEFRHYPLDIRKGVTVFRKKGDASKYSLGKLQTYFLGKKGITKYKVQCIIEGFIWDTISTKLIDR